MCMMLSQCIGREIFCLRRGAQSAQLMVSCDAQLVVLVEDIAPALDERVFARGAAKIAIPYFACALETCPIHIVQLEHALPVDPRANGNHFVELVKRCVFEKHGMDVVV